VRKTLGAQQGDFHTFMGPGRVTHILKKARVFSERGTKRTQGELQSYHPNKKGDLRTHSAE